MELITLTINSVTVFEILFLFMYFVHVQSGL